MRQLSCRGKVQGEIRQSTGIGMGSYNPGQRLQAGVLTCNEVGSRATAYEYVEQDSCSGLMLFVTATYVQYEVQGLVVILETGAS